jgi:hypothetical protein
LVASKLSKFSYPNAKSTKKCNKVFNYLIILLILLSASSKIGFTLCQDTIRNTVESDLMSVTDIFIPAFLAFISFAVTLVALYNCMRALKDYPDLRANEKFMLANALVGSLNFLSILLITTGKALIFSLYAMVSL